MADFLEIVSGRRSVRRFLPDPVPLDDVRELIRVATLAPSGDNRQMWHFVAVVQRELREKMGRAVAKAYDDLMAWPEAHEHLDRLRGSATGAQLFVQAPVTIAVFGKEYVSSSETVLRAAGLTDAAIERLRGRPDMQSIGAAVQTLLLAAKSMGYGTCWMCAPVLGSEEIERLIGASPEWRLKALVPLGRPAEDPSPRPRKQVDEVLEFRV